MAKNKNITPVDSIKLLDKEINYEDFKYKKHFKPLCQLTPNNSKEKLEINVIDEKLYPKQGLVYIFVIKGKIFKIGQSITTIQKRVQSYNCGKIEYRINGTNSTTNYFVLQSLLKINKTVNVYAYFPEVLEYIIFDEKFKTGYPPSKTAENKILKDFIATFKKKPIGCTQT